MLKFNYISGFLQNHLSGYENSFFTKRQQKLKPLKTITKNIIMTHENMSTVQVS